MTERLSRPGVDLVLRLGETNAPRRCQDSDCDRDGEYYVLTGDVLSEFACEEHLEGTVERAQA
ncbi:hypothetical protein [Halalkalicoccus jeotgali]|uniref:Uncharacterized protein n=1 Tax=Halalkalicoccus jeotgali (strain DSM 18796 / CECT 7217 / JCM 14584 / KCTC 4019 / B3) TaxID=795797 RepID=D8J9M7_HALJB|nr:hypothetical protein [Halalkalicoccus jeotgali]ADJ14439.1 hypothetical protein HacjB3_05240 [Halalkalicoccus jeotgali B3]ELY40155.1 hypothetical protein C497_03625 [Halalkalicoccus jeotgali B3]